MDKNDSGNEITTEEEYDQYVISQPHLLDYDDVVYLDEN